MTRCGKLFLPECEYFATNGCVSPFNCPYKIENESITTATSTPCNHYPLETDKDKEKSPDCKPKSPNCARGWIRQNSLLSGRRGRSNGTYKREKTNNKEIS